MHSPADKKEQLRIVDALLKALADPEFKATMNRFRDATKIFIREMSVFGTELKKFMDEDPPDDKVDAKL